MEALQIMELLFQHISVIVLVHWFHIKGCRVLHKITFIPISWDLPVDILSGRNVHGTFTMKGVYLNFGIKILLHEHFEKYGYFGIDICIVVVSNIMQSKILKFLNNSSVLLIHVSFFCFISYNHFQCHIFSGFY